MIKQFHLTLPIKTKGFHIITEDIIKALGPLNESGLLNIFIQHTSAGLAINENADASVRRDLDKSFDELAPCDRSFYEHTIEGPDDMPAHVKSILSGSSVSIPVTKGELQLGKWQGIYLCEFRENATPRKLVMTLLS